jgi:hypothetical protein
LNLLLREDERQFPAVMILLHFFYREEREELTILNEASDDAFVV